MFLFNRTMKLIWSCWPKVCQPKLMSKRYVNHNLSLRPLPSLDLEKSKWCQHLFSCQKFCKIQCYLGFNTASKVRPPRSISSDTFTYNWMAHSHCLGQNHVLIHWKTPSGTCLASKWAVYATELSGSRAAMFTAWKATFWAMKMAKHGERWTSELRLVIAQIFHCVVASSGEHLVIMSWVKSFLHQNHCAPWKTVFICAASWIF